MPGVLRTAWFGKQVRVLMINNKTIIGEVIETADAYIVLSVGKSQMQIMTHAIIAIQPADSVDTVQ